jgi:hypothetical protein
MAGKRFLVAALVFVLCGMARADNPAPAGGPLRISWKGDWLTIRRSALGSPEIRVHYLEAYCRTGSTRRAWDKTVIPHKARLVDASDDGRRIVLEDTLADGVIVRHDITADMDTVSFTVTASNPTLNTSEAAWAQPCVRVGPFTGNEDRAGTAYLPKCFIFLDGKIARMPTQGWAMEALYTPGQVWAAPGVNREDVNPRPLNPATPSCGLIGCFSADEKTIFATAWEPYQELFQGVASCLHSDFRIGGLAAGETKHIRGKIYVVSADVGELVRRYDRDFPAIAQMRR